MPCFTIVAINYEPQTLEEMAYVDDHPIKINYRQFTKERLYKNLNRMNKRDCPVILITDFLILENCNFDIKLCWLKNTKNYQSIKIMINKMIV